MMMKHFIRFIQRQRSQKRLTNPKTSHIVTLEMVQHCNTVNKQTSVIFLHHTIKKLRKGFERKEYCRRKCQREQVQAENLLRGVRQEVHPGAGCVNKVAWHAGLRYHRLCIQHKCQHLCSHRSGTAENFSSPGFCQGTLFFLIQGF